MKFSAKVEKCGLSPMRKFHPYAVAAGEKGRTIYHLNIGQPDIETPKACFDAVRSFDQKVLEYAATVRANGQRSLAAKLESQAKLLACEILLVRNGMGGYLEEMDMSAEITP